jgi:hypothetical protein
MNKTYSLAVIVAALALMMIIGSTQAFGRPITGWWRQRHRYWQSVLHAGRQ